jgi:hypothetical protein
MSPVYDEPILIAKGSKNGNRCRFVANTKHSLHEKWTHLLQRLFAAGQGCDTIRVTFSLKGFYLPGLTSGKDKCAWCSFVYMVDLFLGPIPGYTNEDIYPLCQIDWVDSSRHYTLDNIRWLDNNIANKPHRGAHQKIHRCNHGSRTEASTQRQVRYLAKAVQKLTQEVKLVNKAESY